MAESDIHPMVVDLEKKSKGTVSPIDNNRGIIHSTFYGDRSTASNIGERNTYSNSNVNVRFTADNSFGDQWGRMVEKNPTLMQIQEKSGAFTNHICKKHKMSTGEFIELHGEKYSHLWTTVKSNIDRYSHINLNPKNRVVCKICNESLKILSNSHLKLHGITQSEYKNKYGTIISEFTHGEFSENLSKIEMPPQSKSEREIFEFISSFYSGKIITNTKQIIHPFEVDIYLPDIKLAIELNGLYFHSDVHGGRDKHYHLAKTLKAENLGIRLLHIFEDEWKNKKDIITNNTDISPKNTIVKLDKCVDCNTIIKSTNINVDDELTNIKSEIILKKQIIEENTKSIEKDIHNLYILDRSSIVINDICITGCTLWTDPEVKIPKFIVRIHGMTT